MPRKKAAPDDVRVPHPYRPIADSPNKSCAECFAIPSDPTFAEHHAKRARAKKPVVSTQSKAERVRALLDKGKTVNEIAKALDDVSWAYAWDIAAAWERKTGKTVIPSHAKAAAK